MVSFAILADPATFYEVLFTLVPFIKFIMPKMMYEHICKSVECLQEGERRVAAMEEKKVDEKAIRTSEMNAWTQQ